MKPGEKCPFRRERKKLGIEIRDIRKDMASDVGACVCQSNL